MEKYKVLVITDHSKHSQENSLYALLAQLRRHALCESVEVSTRGLVENEGFFQMKNPSTLWAAPVDSNFAYSKEGEAFREKLRPVDTDNYDWVWLRLPPPLDRPFLDFLQARFEGRVIINAPAGIHLTGSKEFLTAFPDICPPLRVCRTIGDIIALKERFPIVLKPFREYGGKGIVRLDGDKVWMGKNEMDFNNFIQNIKSQPIEYLGVKFLKNVSEGDKRIIVVNGEIMGASLRMPAQGSWLCNVAMGGSARLATVTPEEEHIVARINPTLSQMGIVMYGVDTLVGDDGKRVLSEINTTSIGGLPQMAKQTGLPLVEKAINLIWKFFLKNK